MGIDLDLLDLVLKTWTFILRPFRLEQYIHILAILFMVNLIEFNDLGLLNLGLECWTLRLEPFRFGPFRLGPLDLVL